MAEWLKAPVLKIQGTPTHIKTFHILTKSLLTYLILAFTKNASLLACLSYRTRAKLERNKYVDYLFFYSPTIFF